jgi:hypothetical protein
MTSDAVETLPLNAPSNQSRTTLRNPTGVSIRLYASAQPNAAAKLPTAAAATETYNIAEATDTERGTEIPFNQSGRDQELPDLGYGRYRRDVKGFWRDEAKESFTSDYGPNDRPSRMLSNSDYKPEAMPIGGQNTVANGGKTFRLIACQ